jgi:3-methyladenine DNA glycosylase AlkD
MAQALPTLAAIRAALGQDADPAHAEFHRAYHKSELKFLGLRAAQMEAAWREVWPARQRLSREDVLPLVDPLWDSGVVEETGTAIYLLSRIAKLFTRDDLPLLHAQTRRCTGWAQLDFLALKVLGPVAVNHSQSASVLATAAAGHPIYAPVMAWLDDEWLWTRRAAVLIHAVPARQGKLDHRYAWPSFAARLHEKEFFIRKAIGWALRECVKHYPERVVEFVQQHRGAMSGLTLREATRNLPEELRQQALG